MACTILSIIIRPVARLQDWGGGGGSFLGEMDLPGGLGACSPGFEKFLNSTLVRLHLVSSGGSMKWLLR